MGRSHCALGTSASGAGGKQGENGTAYALAVLQHEETENRNQDEVDQVGRGGENTQAQAGSTRDNLAELLTNTPLGGPDHRRQGRMGNPEALEESPHVGRLRRELPGFGSNLRADTDRDAS